MLTETHLYREIHEQPAVLDRLLHNEKPAAEKLAAAIRERNIDHVIIAARGTSDNAARYAKYLLGAVNGLPVALATPSLFSIYGRPPLFGNALVLGISQSGHSPDIAAVVAEARKQGALTAAITNVPDSRLGNTAEHLLYLNAGPEQSVAATKTYTTELAAIALLSSCLANDETMTAVLADLPQIVENTLAVDNQIATRTERYRYMERCVVIGRGFNYASAFELALKMKELTYVMVEPYSSADFMHGPLALIEPGFPVVVFAADGALHDELGGFVETLQERGAEVIAIGNDDRILSAARVPLRFPAVAEWLSPIPAIVVGQQWAMHLAHTRGLDVDRPRALNKVTATR